MAQSHQLPSIIIPITPTNLPKPHSNNHSRMCFPKIKAEITTLQEHPFPPNAMRRKLDSTWIGGFSLGIDLGLSRTGLAISKGFSVRPLKVLELRGQKLEMSLIEIAQQQEVDEFIVGLPISSVGKETPQSNKVRSVAGRIAIRAAERYKSINFTV
ncbi:uncharacterized protein LOC143632059 [Bidens hawaiensis]|uniref:uncharacterized protein LOC143632059 n=1 Tax=Bidens hawaiensis TaxID=980011 RepID=UPI00404B7BF1